MQLSMQARPGNEAGSRPNANAPPPHLIQSLTARFQPPILAPSLTLQTLLPEQPSPPFHWQATHIMTGSPFECFPMCSALLTQPRSPPTLPLKHVPPPPLSCRTSN